MSKSKRVLACLLSFILIVSSAVPARAEEDALKAAAPSEAGISEEADVLEETGGSDASVVTEEVSEAEKPEAEPGDAGILKEDPGTDDLTGGSSADVPDEVQADELAPTENENADTADAAEEEIAEDVEPSIDETEEMLEEEAASSIESLEAQGTALREALPAEIIEDGVTYYATGSYSERNGRLYPIYETEFSELIPYEELEEYYVSGAGYNHLGAADSDTKDYYYLMYNQLDASQKKVYDALKKEYHKLSDPDASVEVLLDEVIRTSERLQEVAFYPIAALDVDDPNVFWLYNRALAVQRSIQTDTVSKKSRVVIKRNTEKYPTMLTPVYENWAAVQKDLDEMEANKKELVEEARNTHEFYDKIRIINDYIIDENYYNRYIYKYGSKNNPKAVEGSKAYIQTSALTQQYWMLSSTDQGDPTSPVCEGYARAFKTVCDDLGIPCILVMGKDNPLDAGSAGHMWNYVQNKDSGIWYAVDTTWDDPVRYDEWINPKTPEQYRHAYMLVGSQTPDSTDVSKTFIEKHQPNASKFSGGEPFKVPELSETRLEEDHRFVSFDACGGVADRGYILLRSGDAIGELPAATRQGYLFLGWFTDSKGGLQVAPEKICESSMKVYAHWKLMPTVAAPDASFPSGAGLEPGTKIALTSGTSGAVIRYTLDGSSPADRENPSVMIYKEEIVLDRSLDIRAMAYKEGYIDSDIVEYSYRLDEWGDIKENLTEEELTAEGISSSDKIPAGLWCAGIRDMEYNGGAVTLPDLKVFHGRKLLTSKDYTVKYSSNKNAGNAEIAITGKGNYAGRVACSFKILPIDLSAAKAAVIAPDIITYADGRAQQGITSVSCMAGGSRILLKNNTDFTFTYDGGSYVEPGNYTITIEGKAPNFTGKASFTEIILDSTQASGTVKQVGGLRISVPSVTIRSDGKAAPLVQVRDGSRVLTQGEDYTVSFDGLDKAGTAYAFITGVIDKGYAGTAVKQFQIKSRPLGRCLISGISSWGCTYPGAELTVADIPEFEIYCYNESGRRISLVQGTDYEVSYKNNKKKGKATIICKGIGLYTGTLKKTVKIVPCDIAFNSERITVEELSAAPYQKGGAKPDVVMRDGTKRLICGVDYKLSYRNNREVGADNEATVVITGKGNYTGTISRQFTVKNSSIIKADLSVADIVYTGKPLKKAPAVKLTDTNGKKLKAGTDYETSIRLQYADGRDFKYKEDVLEVGTEIHVIVTGKGNYVGADDRNPDEKIVVCRCIAANVSKAVVKVAPQYYTGSAIHPTRQDITEIYIRKGGAKQVIEPSEYEIAGYGDNIKRGKGTIVIRGVGNYGGTKNVSFAIRARWMEKVISAINKVTGGED